MFKKITYKIKIVILSLGLIFSTMPNVLASNFTHISDFISTSRPGLQANHEINFLTTKTIPPSGRIRIIFDDDFLIQSGFDKGEVDILTSTSSDSGFQNREIATTSSATEDSVVLGSIASSTYIEIILNSSTGISSSTYVKILLGDNATYSEFGDKYLINPGIVQSYPIEVQSFNAGGSLLDRADPRIAIVESVSMISNMPKVRSHGSPTGTLAFGTVSTIMSLVTNYKAYCSFSTASNTPYVLMTDEFSYTGNYFHSITLTGLVGGLHDYFVRCRDLNSVDDTSDYEIIFYVENYPGEGTGDDNSSTTDDGTGGNTGDGTGGDSSNSGGSGGGGGGGGGGGAGSKSGIYDPYDVPPEDPAIDFTGFAYPNSQVFLLVDGVATQNVRANSLGAFELGIEALDRGIYTFGIYAKDSEENNSLTYNTTFYVEEGTKSSVSDVFIAPTINTNSIEINPGDSMNLHGYGAASTITEISFYPYLERDLREEEIIKQSIEVDANGLWNMILNTDKAFSGQYRLKARSNKENIGFSEFSNVINIGVGEAVEKQEGECSGADLNKDGKVNITDFSIMLYYWKTDNACADQNSSGNVDLTDFSIMMFYWTG